MDFEAKAARGKDGKIIGGLTFKEQAKSCCTSFQ